MSSPENTELVDSPASLFLFTTGAIGLTGADTKIAIVEAMVAPCSDRWRKPFVISAITTSITNRSYASLRAVPRGEFVVLRSICQVLTRCSGKRFHSRSDLDVHQRRPH